MVTVYAVPFLALTVQVEPFSAVIVPINPRPWPDLPGAVVGGAVTVDGVVVVGVALGLLDAPEHAATPTATEALIIPIATVLPIPARSQPVTLVIGPSSLIRYSRRCCAFRYAAVRCEQASDNLRVSWEMTTTADCR